MQSPRASAASRMAGATITQAAREAASCCWYLGLLRKLSCVGVGGFQRRQPVDRQRGVAAELAAERLNDCA